ncbi:MAG: hypothetical protein KJ914_10915 [Gammaproteobacteria bacterium]|nr:hypothetical protein [Gammaproteobacteria bacterium]MBU1723463.1 hypothetical protein [Gammaproteobacteria bacterium]MBU2004415.1 hypothetical protein [Gammaproteobacteria bacterium]
MKTFYYYVCAAVLLGVANQAMALGCEVEYKAKRVNQDRRWYGSVERPEFKTGTATGSGSDLKACEKNAVASVQRDGWKVTSYKLK